MSSGPAEPRIAFLIGGAQKCGTSALAQYLQAHPQLRLPLSKEAHVFDAEDFDPADSVSEIDARFAGQFEDDCGDALHGDATPFYLFHAEAVARIARYNPAMRWIILLREPAERALSHYRMERTRGRESLPMSLAMLLEPWRIAGERRPLARGSRLRRCSYRARSDYARQLDHLLAHFPREQVLLIRSEHLLRDPHAQVQAVCAFLGVAPPSERTDYPPVFVGAAPMPARDSLTMRWLRWLLRRERTDARQRYGIDFDAD